MTRLAEAEKFPGHVYWTVYDGKGGVYRAKRFSFGWLAQQINGNGPIVRGDTLREIRQQLGAR